MQIQHPPIRTGTELGRANATRIARQIQYELAVVLSTNNLTQEALAYELGYKSQAGVSKLIGGHSHLPLPKAEILDSLGHQTSIGTTFAELVRARRAAGKPSASQRPSMSKLIADVFLASPMASVADARDYATERNAALDVAQAIETYSGRTVYYAGRELESEEHFDASDIAAENNFAVLHSCNAFVLLATTGPERPSGVHVEAGYALAAGVPSLYLVPQTDALPYPLRGLSQHTQFDLLPRVQIHHVANSSRAVALLRRSGPEIFDRLEVPVRA